LNANTSAQTHAGDAGDHQITEAIVESFPRNFVPAANGFEKVDVAHRIELDPAGAARFGVAARSRLSGGASEDFFQSSFSVFGRGQREVHRRRHRDHLFNKERATTLERASCRARKMFLRHATGHSGHFGKKDPLC
jgi:hypothetical protein